MILAQLETIVTTVDKASDASDRWLFLAALAIIIVGGTVCIRWLVNAHEKKDATHAEAFKELHALHLAERTEWKATDAKAQASFMEALRLQRVDFRDEIAKERLATATMIEAVKVLAGPRIG